MVGLTGLVIGQVPAGRIVVRIVVETGQAREPAIEAEALQTVAEKADAGAVAIALATARYRRTAVADRGAAADFPVQTVAAMHVRAVHAVPRAWEAPVAVAAEGGGNRSMNKEKYLSSGKWNPRAGQMETTMLLISLLVLAPILSSIAWPDQQSGEAGIPAQKTFATPDEALTAFISAADSYNVPELEAILGPGSEDLVASEDPVQDKNRTAAFVAKAKEKHAAFIDPRNSNRAVVIVGNDDWPGPIPIVKRYGKWMFDAKAGRQEILFRRIGSNELDAIAICRGYVDAQQEYALTKHDGSEVNQYAQRVISTPGKHDGLVWKNDGGTLGGPIAEGIANALQQGYTNKSQPYHGYYFKILKGQGPAVPMGELDYVVGGAMIGGFALAAAPAEYRVTGVKTFAVNQNGVVYQKDLGPDTLKIFSGMELYNPDKTWTPTDDSW